MNVTRSKQIQPVSQSIGFKPCQAAFLQGGRAVERRRMVGHRHKVDYGFLKPRPAQAVRPLPQFQYAFFYSFLAFEAAATTGAVGEAGRDIRGLLRGAESARGGESFVLTVR